MIETHDKPSAYDFESQLELGEMLLSLGRIQDAEVELKKARDLNEIGAYSTPDGDPQRQEHLQRLAVALKRVGEMQTGSSRSNRLVWTLGILGLLAALVLVFAAWIFNRAELLETSTSATREAEALEFQQTESASRVELADAENTRTVNEIIERDRSIATLEAFNTEQAQLAQVAGDSAEAAATAAAAALAMADEMESSGGGIANTPQVVVITVEAPTPVGNEEADSEEEVTAATPEGVSAPVDGDQMRITSPAANFRRGPGFEYGVIRTLRQDDLVRLLAVSPDSYWYNVEADDGMTGWVHTSLVKPVTLDWVPVAEIIPPTPIPPRPTSTPVPPTETPLPPTETPLPPTETPLPPTETPLPPTEEATETTPEASPSAEATEENGDDATATAEPPPPDATLPPPDN